MVGWTATLPLGLWFAWLPQTFLFAGVEQESLNKEEKQMLGKLGKRMKGEGGFTLIELLVVIIIIAILAAIAIPTFLGQRQKAQDAAAKSLVRNAMTAYESQYVDNRTFAVATVTAAVLQAIEPSITFSAAAGHVAAADGGTLVGGSAAAEDTVDYFGDATTYSIATLSESANEFGVYVSKTAGGGTTFVKEIGDDISSGW